MSRDIVSCLTGLWAWPDVAGLVVAGWVQGEFAKQVAVGGDDADVQLVDQQQDVTAAVGLAEADVVQPAVVAQGDGAVVDHVATDVRELATAPKSCSNSSGTVSVTDDLLSKHDQRFYYGSRDHGAFYDRRTYVEGVFGSLKNPDTEKAGRGFTKYVGLPWVPFMHLRFEGDLPSRVTAAR